MTMTMSCHIFLVTLHCRWYSHEVSLDVNMGMGAATPTWGDSIQGLDVDPSNTYLKRRSRCSAEWTLAIGKGKNIEKSRHGNDAHPNSISIKQTLWINSPTGQWGRCTQLLHGESCFMDESCRRPNNRMQERKRWKKIRCLDSLNSNVNPEHKK